MKKNKPLRIKDIVNTKSCEQEAEELLSDKEYKIICDLCGRKYISRPFLCLCKSNCFLIDIC